MSHISKAGAIEGLSSEAAAGQAAEFLGPRGLRDLTGDLSSQQVNMQMIFKR